MEQLNFDPLKKNSKQSGSERNIETAVVKETSSGSKPQPEKHIEVKEHPYSVPKNLHNSGFNFDSREDDIDLLGVSINQKKDEVSSPIPFQSIRPEDSSPQNPQVHQSTLKVRSV